MSVIFLAVNNLEHNPEKGDRYIEAVSKPICASVTYCNYNSQNADFEVLKPVLNKLANRTYDDSNQLVNGGSAYEISFVKTFLNSQK